MQLQLHADLLELFPGLVLAMRLEHIKPGRWWSEELATRSRLSRKRVIA